MPAPNIDIAALRACIGRQEIVADTLPAFSASALAATLDLDDRFEAGDCLPPLWHWVYFLDLHKSAELAENGHVKHGGFLPAMPLPRRMFAGARLTFHRPLRIGERAQRISTIADIDHKRGSSGDLVFMRMRNEFLNAEGLALTEEQDIVYRQPQSASVAPRVENCLEEHAPWVREIEANETLLFRYSALIFNAHRIHWDRPYAQDKEGYAGLIVHGQLIATWLAELARSNSGRPFKSFRFRSLRALLDHARCRLCGEPSGDSVRLWAEDERGVVMEAHAELA